MIRASNECDLVFVVLTWCLEDILSLRVKICLIFFILLERGGGLGLFYPLQDVPLPFSMGSSSRDWRAELSLFDSSYST
jgi:hypothetical protein